jgi:sec-independent protein translocase protein TatB
MDSFFGIGFLELAFIAILALIVLGPQRLPEAMREVAKAIKQIRELSNEFTSQFSEELKVLDELNPQKLMNDIMQDAVTPSKEPTQKPKPKTASKPTAAKIPDKPLAESKPAPAPSSEPESASENHDDAAPEAIEEEFQENSIPPSAAVDSSSPAIAVDAPASDDIVTSPNGGAPDSMETNGTAVNGTETSDRTSDAHDQTEKRA